LIKPPATAIANGHKCRLVESNKISRSTFFTSYT
jgi:hypothetical protein